MFDPTFFKEKLKNIWTIDNQVSVHVIYVQCSI